MANSASGHLRLAAALAAAVALPHSVAAQTIEALDALVPAKVPDALALAQSQVAGASWLDALATLERVLIADPKNKPALLLHASVLCRIDDRGGANAEFARLKAKDYKKPAWAAARAPCTAPQGGST